MSNSTIYYRSDLLREAFDVKGLSLRRAEAESGVAVNTWRAALEGSPLQSEKLKSIADFLGVKWLELHDVEFTIKPLVIAQIHN